MHDSDPPSHGIKADTTAANPGTSFETFVDVDTNGDRTARLILEALVARASISAICVATHAVRTNVTRRALVYVFT